mgnify:CR=1 FL=1|jgi:hypothetical protein
MLSLLCFTITSQAQTKTEEIDFTGMRGRGIEVKKIERSGVILLFDGGKDTTYVPAFYDKKDNEEAALRMYYGNILTIKGINGKIKKVRFWLVTKVSDKWFSTLKENKKGAIPLNPNRKGIAIWESSGNGVDSIVFTTSRDTQARIKKIEVTYKIDPVVFTISAARHATLYYSNKAFTIPQGVVARTYKIEDNMLKLSKKYVSGDVLPKDMAVVLEADEGSYTFWMTEKQGEKDEKNVLKGTDDNSQTTGGTIYYGFSNGKRGVGFYWRKADGGAFENGAHKAYIAYTPSSTAQAKSYLVFDTATGVHLTAFQESQMEDEPTYNLAGQRVGKDYKGIIIIRGKKYLRK